MTVKMTRKGREQQQRRGEILAAARELFSRHGYDRTGMAQIAERAEFAVGTLYKFFKDKEALYGALILETVREIARTLIAALEAPGTELEKLECYLTTKAELFVRHIPTARLYFAQTAGASFVPWAGLDREAKAIYQEVLDALETLCRDGMRKGVILEMDPKMLVLGLEGVSNAFLNVLIERPGDFTAESLASMSKTIFFERIRLKP